MFRTGTKIRNINSSHSEHGGEKVKQRKDLIERRKELNLTQEQVAISSGISRAYYTNIEAGRKEPSIGVAKKIADTLTTTVDRIFFSDIVPNRNTA
jgi:DNA-binding XRE family transcriptional regulator